MADPLLELDPVSEDAANSPLSIWNTADYLVGAFNAPAPPLRAQWASSVDTEGSRLAGPTAHENRTISITVACYSAAALRTLQGKIGKFAREGGTAKLTLPAASEVVIFDELTADSFDPQLDIVYFTNSGAFCVVSLTLTAKPYGRGPEVDLGDNVETTLPVLIFTETGLKGDMPGLGRLVVDNDDASNAQTMLLWGIQSRYYSADATAALFYQAEACAIVGGSGAATAVGPAGASGAGSNTILQNALTTSFASQIYVGTSSTAQTHIGSFRVFARVWAPTANTGVVSVRLQWLPETGALTYVENSSVSLTGDPTLNVIEGKWLLVDLGLVSIPKAAAGTQGWLGQVQAMSTVAGDDLYIDWLMLVPVSEGSGQVIYTKFSPAIAAGGGSVHVRHDGALVSGSGGFLSRRTMEGDYLRVPPSGAENRTLRAIVKLSRGELGSVPNSATLCIDPGTDDISARLFYTPRYLVVPEP